jgi:hypothetical protein
MAGAGGYIAGTIPGKVVIDVISYANEYIQTGFIIEGG